MYLFFLPNITIYRIPGNLITENDASQVFCWKLTLLDFDSIPGVGSVNNAGKMPVIHGWMIIGSPGAVKENPWQMVGHTVSKRAVLGSAQ